MSNRRLLISYAHPDDESFGLGGLIARYVAEGVEVSLICATNGERGTVKEEFLEGYNSIAALRLAELECASEKLGFKHVVKLGYKDSGMMGSETSNDADCLWQAQEDEVTRRVVEVIRDLKPQVVITFNRYGGYGHPDHIAIQRATTNAFPLASDRKLRNRASAVCAAKTLLQQHLGAADSLGRRADAPARARPAPFRAQQRLRSGGDPRPHRADRTRRLTSAIISMPGTQPAPAMPARLAAAGCASRNGRGAGISPYQNFTRIYPAPTSNRHRRARLFRERARG